MSKDRQETEVRIVAAGFAVLAEAGLPGFGVNAVARAAGCDKKLIYRYFEGEEGLLAAMGAASGQAMAFALQGALREPVADYAGLVARLLRALAAHLAEDALAREAARVALAAPEAAAAPFRAARASVLREWFARAKAETGLAAPEGADAAAVNAVLIAGVEALAVAGDYAGLSFLRDGVRIGAALERLSAVQR
jgi:AcrR family transcriptional regulator